MAMSAVATIRTLQNDSNRRVAILNEIHFSSLHLFQGTHPGNPESSVSLGIKSVSYTHLTLPTILRV